VASKRRCSYRSIDSGRASLPWFPSVQVSRSAAGSRGPTVIAGFRQTRLITGLDIPGYSV
jgi:hypothetical protein